MEKNVNQQRAEKKTRNESEKMGRRRGGDGDDEGEVAEEEKR